MIFHILFHELDKKQYGKAVKHIELYRSSYPMLSLPSLVLPPTSLAALLVFPPRTIPFLLSLWSCLSCPASLVLPLWSCLSGPASLVRSLLSCLTPHIFFLLAPSSFLYSMYVYLPFISSSLPFISSYLPYYFILPTRTLSFLLSAFYFRLPTLQFPPTYHPFLSSYLSFILPYPPCLSTYLPCISSYLPCLSSFLPCMSS